MKPRHAAVKKQPFHEPATKPIKPLKYAKEYRASLPEMTDTKWRELNERHGLSLRFDQLPDTRRVDVASGFVRAWLLREDGDRKPTRQLNGKEFEPRKPIESRSDDLDLFAETMSKVLHHMADGLGEVKAFRAKHLPNGLLHPDPLLLERWILERHRGKVSFEYVVTTDEPLTLDPARGYILDSGPRPSAARSVSKPYKLRYPGHVGEHSKGIPVTRDGPLGELFALQEKLTQFFKCYPAEATAFVLCGSVPEFQPISTKARSNEFSTLQGAVYRTTRTLEFDSSVTPRRLYECLLSSAPSQAKVGKVRPLGNDTLRLVQFWLKHGPNEVDMWKRENPESKVTENKVYNRRAQEAFESLIQRARGDQFKPGFWD